MLLSICLVSLSGCLGDDIWREPFLWSQKLEVGQGLDGAQAFANTFGALGEQGQQQGGEAVSTVEDLPQNVVFQNLREFMEQQSPGSGDQAAETVEVVTSNASQGYQSLTGPLAEAYSQFAQNLSGTKEPIIVPIEDRTTRVRLALDVVLTRPPPSEENGSNPTPLNVVQVRLFGPGGHEKAVYRFDHSGHLEDQFVTGTYGDRNEVREHLGGAWSVEVFASGEGSWALTMDAYEPEYDDWRFYQFWRADLREVVSG